MKLISRYPLLLADFAAFLTFSCRKDLQSDFSAQPGGNALVADRDGEAGTGPTILGQKRDNPYAVETIRKAYNNLYSSTTLATLSAKPPVRTLPAENPGRRG